MRLERSLRPSLRQTVSRGSASLLATAFFLVLATGASGCSSGGGGGGGAPGGGSGDLSGECDATISGTLDEQPVTLSGTFVLMNMGLQVNGTWSADDGGSVMLSGDITGTIDPLTQMLDFTMTLDGACAATFTGSASVVNGNQVAGSFMTATAPGGCIDFEGMFMVVSCVEPPQP